MSKVIQGLTPADNELMVKFKEIVTDAAAELRMHGRDKEATNLSLHGGAMLGIISRIEGERKALSDAIDGALV